MKLIKKLQKSTSDAICYLFEENKLFFVLSETKESIQKQFKCKSQPTECFISSVDDQSFSGNYFAEVDFQLTV